MSAFRHRSAGDSHEFEALLAAHRGIVMKLASAYCPRGEERDDLAQEIHLQLWRSYPRYDPSRRFSTWMYRVALNTAISYSRAAGARARRSISLEKEPAAQVVAPTTAPEHDERLEGLYRFLHGLDELNRALVVLYLEERSYREIAEVLGIGESNVGTKLNRLKGQMRRALAAREEKNDGTP